MDEPVARKTLLQYSMEGGLWLGLYLIVRFVFMVLGSYNAPANIVALALFAGTPVVLYKIMMRYHRDNGYMSFFSLLWMMGIMLFFFAALICAVPEYIFYRYINPHYITDIVEQALHLLDEMQMTDAQGIDIDEMRRILDDSNAFSPIQMILQSLWSNVFFGSLVSMAVAPFVLRKRKK